jgi:hypothetical protein
MVSRFYEVIYKSTFIRFFVRISFCFSFIKSNQVYKHNQKGNLSSVLPSSSPLPIPTAVKEATRGPPPLRRRWCKSVSDRDSGK